MAAKQLPTDALSEFDIAVIPPLSGGIYQVLERIRIGIAIGCGPHNRYRKGAGNQKKDIWLNTGSERI